MYLYIWLLYLPPEVAAPLMRAYRSLLGRRVTFRLLSPGLTPNDIPDLLGTASALPDLLITDLSRHQDAIKQLLLALRDRRPVDLMVITRDRSPGVFTRAHQLAAVDYLLFPCRESRLLLSVRHYLAMRQHFQPGRLLTQSDLDPLLPLTSLAPGHDAASEHLDKSPEAFYPFSGKNAPVYAEIWSFLKENSSGQTLSVIAGTLHLSPSTTRRYLEDMISMGYLSKTSFYNGKSGRPSFQYRSVYSDHRSL